MGRSRGRNWIIREFEALLRRAGIPKSMVRLEFKRYKTSAGLAVLRRRPPHSIRIDPRVIQVLDAKSVRHVLAHEIAHVKLHMEGGDRISNSLHLTSFYRVLARIAGYSSVEEARRIDSKLRIVLEEKINSGDL